MPYPTQVNREQIVATARQIISTEGYDALSLAKLAEALGIKAPSLYKHVRDKSELLLMVNTQTITEITVVMAQSANAHGDVGEKLQAMGHAYRGYALAHPILYELAFSNTIPNTRPDERLLESLAIELQRVWENALPAEHSLNALRGIWALVHGFVILEIGQQFQRGGNLQHAFESAIRAFVVGELALHASRPTS